MHSAIPASLRCPVSGDKLVLSEDKKELISEKAQLAFPIRDGIPVLLPKQARKLQTET